MSERCEHGESTPMTCFICLSDKSLKQKTDQSLKIIRYGSGTSRRIIARYDDVCKECGNTIEASVTIIVLIINRYWVCEDCAWLKYGVSK